MDCNEDFWIFILKEVPYLCKENVSFVFLYQHLEAVKEHSNVLNIFFLYFNLGCFLKQL